MMQYVNEMARRIHEVYPEIAVEYQAYWWAMQPPETMDDTAEPRRCVQLEAPFGDRAVLVLRELELDVDVDRHDPRRADPTTFERVGHAVDLVVEGEHARQLLVPRQPAAGVVDRHPPVDPDDLATYAGLRGRAAHLLGAYDELQAYLEAFEAR